MGESKKSPNSGKSILMKNIAILGIALLGVVFPLKAASYYPLRLDDPKAVYLTKEQFPIKADGSTDDSAAIQAAIDKAEAAHGEGIVFVPEGRYRITRTIYVWPGVRIIGYGANRPVFVLADNTPGYQQGIGYMFFFTGGRPGSGRFRERQPSGPRSVMEGTVPPSNNVIDANPGTFYSAMSNVDFEIGSGDPAAIGIRFHVAQHCYLAHMDFHIGSGQAALKDIGNEAEDLHFYGGDYGIITQKPSPGWQFTLLDSTFEGQRKVAIREHEAGLTLIHDAFRNVPEAISIDPNYAEELWAKDVRFENVSGPAITISNVNNPRTEINLENITCRHVPVLALLRETEKQVAGPGESYVVKAFSHGLTMSAPGTEGGIQTNLDAEAVKDLPPFGADAIRALPPASTWVNLQSLGAKGDGVTDDTAAVQKAIAEHRVLYVPMGRYVVSDTLKLRPDTVLIGLHPSMTQFDLPDGTAAFQGPGAPKPLLEAPQGGHNIVTGIGLYTNGINSRAVGAMWMADEDSLMDDVRFLGGHGTNAADGTRINPYNNTHTADPDIHRRWDGQYPSLWITNGGGGTFANIWTPSTFAQAGLYISNTTTPGRVYELSSEHHVRNEVKLDGVENWELDAIQTEEERGESGFALPLEISRSKNITIANYHGYRVVSSYQPFPCAIKLSESHDIHFRNVHVDSDSKAAFGNSVFDATHHAEVRAYEFASLNVPEQYSVQAQHPLPPMVASGTQLERLATGFFNISGAAVDPEGQLYFVDAHWQRIYRWVSKNKEAVVVRDNPLDPVNLAFDKAGNLIVVSYAGKGTVYSLRPGTPMDQITLLKSEAAADRPGMTPLLPVDVWSSRSISGDRPYQYVSPDHSVFIPAGEDFVQGQLYYGTKMADILRAYSLAKAAPGHPFYISDESDEKTYKGSVTDKGTITDLKLFAERGGESVAQDRDGNIYLATGQVFVYSPKGDLLGRIDVPERPTGVIFGGPDRDTLYILTRGSLYAVKTKVPGL
jgi:sugar lactone lactonase YvrE